MLSSRFAWIPATLQFTFCVLAAIPCSAAQRATGDPTKFRFGHDPQMPIFYPGNSGRALFQKNPPASPGNLQYNEEAQTDGQMIELYSTEYDFSPVTEDANSTRPAGYWPRLEANLAQAAFY